MTGETFEYRKRPRFYKEPSEEDIEAKGRTLAEIHAGIRARIFGSRVLASTVALGTGTLISASELYSNKDLKPLDVICNFGIPIAFNLFAEIKVENNLRKTEREITKIIPKLIDTQEATNDILTPTDEK
jgi:hypothetical protein